MTANAHTETSHNKPLETSLEGQLPMSTNITPLKETMPSMQDDLRNEEDFANDREAWPNDDDPTAEVTDDAEDPRRKAFGALMRVNRLQAMLHHRHMAQHGPAADPSRGQGRVLALLQVKDGLATRDMANILGIRPSSLNETLARLEREGLVERRQNEADKRQQLVYLTEAGRAFDARPKRPGSVAFAGFTNEELAQLTGYLERVAKAMEEELGPEAQEFMERGRRRREELFGERGHGMHHHGPKGHGPHHGPHGNGHGRPQDDGPRGPRDWTDNLRRA